MGNTFGKSSTFTWNNLLDYILSIGVPQVKMILLKQQPVADPCVLLNNNIINLATQFAKSGENVAYLTGYGDCVHCKKPTIYTLASPINMQAGIGITGGWNSQMITDRSSLSNNLDSTINNEGLYYIYLLTGDNNFNITGITSVYKLQNNQFVQLPGCNPTSRQDVVPNKTNWLIIILIIILIIFIAYILLSNRKEKRVRINTV